MTDLINELISRYYPKRKLATLKRYLKLRYHIEVDLELLRKRLNMIQGVSKNYSSP